MLPDCGPVPQHAINRRVIPFRRWSKWRDVLSGEMISDGVAAESSYAKLEDLADDLSLLGHKDK